MKIFEMGFQLLICFFEFYMFAKFMDCMLEKREKTAQYKMAFLIGASFLLFFINTGNNSFLNLVFAFSLYCAGTFILYKDSIKNTVYLSVIFYFIIVGGELLIAIILQFMGAEIDIENNPFHVIMGMCSAKLLSFFVIQFTMNRAHKNHHVNIPYAWSFYMFPASSIVIYIGIYYSDIDFQVVDNKKLFLLVACLFLFISNIAYFAIFQKTVEHMKQISALEIYQAKNKLADMHYEKTAEYFSQYRKLHHDIAPLLNLMSEMAKDEKNKELLKLLEGLGGQLQKISRTETAYCSNDIINLILSEKEAEARQKNISCFIMVEPCYVLGKVDEYDLVGILHNVFENAMEAVLQCPAGTGFISIQMFISDDGKYSVLRVENNYADEPRYAKGFLKTSKKKGDHGLGMSIIEEKVDKYKGCMDYAARDKVFCLTILLPIV